jgi:hypothetical protein
MISIFLDWVSFLAFGIKGFVVVVVVVVVVKQIISYRQIQVT